MAAAASRCGSTPRARGSARHCSNWNWTYPKARRAGCAGRRVRVSESPRPAQPALRGSIMAVSDADLLLVDDSDPAVGVVTLNRPDKRNALNVALIEQL